MKPSLWSILLLLEFVGRSSAVTHTDHSGTGKLGLDFNSSIIEETKVGVYHSPKLNRGFTPANSGSGHQGTGSRSGGHLDHEGDSDRGHPSEPQPAKGKPEEEKQDEKLEHQGDETQRKKEQDEGKTGGHDEGKQVGEPPDGPAKDLSPTNPPPVPRPNDPVIETASGTETAPSTVIPTESTSNIAEAATSGDLTSSNTATDVPNSPPDDSGANGSCRNRWVVLIIAALGPALAFNCI